MSLLRDMLAELAGMFVADARLSLALLIVVGITAALINLANVPGPFVGATLTCGVVAVLFEAVFRTARRHRLKT